jgi:uncharacterized protein YbcI
VTANLAAIQARYYGRGPEGGKAYVCDDVLVCVLRGGLLQVEEFMLAQGRETFVREVRLAWRDEIAETMTGAVERITGYRVLDYHSQVLLKAAIAVEMFVLDAESRKDPTD